MTVDAGVLLVSTAAISSFVAAFHWSGLVSKSRIALEITAKAMAVISEKTMPDDEKQQVVQRLAKSLFAHFGIITLTTILLILSPGLMIWLGDLTGLASSSSVFTFLMDWRVILLSTAIILAGICAVRRI